MAVQRKVFRIEEYSPPRGPDGNAAHGALSELQALRELMDPNGVRLDRGAFEKAQAQIAEAQSYKRELGLIHAAVQRTRGDMTALGADMRGGEKTARASRELSEIVSGTEKATQKILQAAEEIDHAAGTLSAALKSGHDKGLAHEIQERVVQIFEACNFQDLTGQRVARVVAALKFVEDHVARLMQIWQAIEQFKPALLESADGERRYLNGPMLPGDPGHSTQDDVDGMFAAPAVAGSRLG